MYRDAAPGHRAYADTLFQAWRGQPVGEITPDYAYLKPEVFAEMAAVDPDVRFLFIMRDPIDRLVSALRMSMRAHAHRGAADRGNGVRGSAREGRRRPRGTQPAAIAVRPDDRAAQLVVSPEKIGYFFYETILTQPEVDRLTDFLGVARRSADFGKRVHAARGDEGGLGR